MKITKELLDREWLEAQIEAENQKKFEEVDRKRKETAEELAISIKVETLLDKELGDTIRKLNRLGYQQVVLSKTGIYRSLDDLNLPVNFTHTHNYPALGFNPNPEKGYTKILLEHLKSANLKAYIFTSVNKENYYLIIDWS